MTVDETKRSESIRQDQMREAQAPKPKPKAKDGEFQDILKKSQMAQPFTALQGQQKTVTEQAIQESAKREERQSEDQRRDDGKRERKGDSQESGDRSSTRHTEQKVYGKGSGTQGDRGSGGGGGGREGGFESAMGKRSLSRQLSKAGVRSLPVDLQTRFASRLAKAQGTDAARQAALSQQVLNKIVQYVRVGINRAGEKEIQLDLHEKIFRGLKLRVTARDGKVAVHFRTSDTRGREVFEQNEGAIRKALAEKGIEVAEFIVS